MRTEDVLSGGVVKKIGLGLIGFGTVGAGVVEGLQKHADLIADRTGVELVLRRIADLDLEKDRGVTVDRAILTRDADAVIRDPEIDIVIELIGGIKAAREVITKALSLGKPVVTANKALLAEHGAEIFELAAKNNTELGFEASVGGGIPIIQALRQGLVANRIESMHGILNGTCNYILTRMERERLPFDQVLREAQAAGYAEANPSLDIDGHDTAHKAVVLASLAYGFQVPLKSVYVEGIRNVAAADIEYAVNLGYRIKLLAVVKDVDGEIEIRVQPTMVPMDHLLASVSGVFNAIFVEGDVVGQALFYGRGAGRLPTASAVISDLTQVARNLANGVKAPLPVLYGRGRYSRIRKIGAIEARYYLRVSLLDRPGVLGHIASVLGKHGVSIASVLQKEVRAGEYVPVIIVTHLAKEREFEAAIREIDAMAEVGAPTVRLRIEDLKAS